MSDVQQLLELDSISIFPPSENNMAPSRLEVQNTSIQPLLMRNTIQRPMELVASFTVNASGGTNRTSNCTTGNSEAVNLKIPVEGLQKIILVQIDFKADGKNTTNLNIRLEPVNHNTSTRLPARQARNGHITENNNGNEHESLLVENTSETVNRWGWWRRAMSTRRLPTQSISNTIFSSGFWDRATFLNRNQVQVAAQNWESRRMSM